MTTAKSILALQLVGDGRSAEALTLAGDAHRRLAGTHDSAAPPDAAQVSQRLVASLIEVIAAAADPDEDVLTVCERVIDEARAAGRPAFAAAAAAVGALRLVQTNRLPEALVMLAHAELDLAEELSWEEPADPPGGPTGPGAAANNLGVVCLELCLFSHAEPHFVAAARASAESYGPDYLGQACIDHTNLLAFRLAWALEMEADGDPLDAELRARQGLEGVDQAVRLAEAADWRMLGDYARVLGLGCQSIAEPGSVPVTARHDVRAIVETSPEGSLLRGAAPWLVVARLCRMAGDAAGAQQAAQRAAASADGNDVWAVVMARREAMLASVPPGSPALDYVRSLRDSARRHAESLAHSLDQRIEMLRLERTLAESKQEETRLQHAAEHDPLTGLLNRAALQLRLAQALDVSRTSASVALAFIDLDGFKRVNDRSGHDAGDQLLAKVAEALRGCVRDTDTLARYGGDEFVAIREAVDDVAELGAWADRIRVSVEAAAFSFDPGVQVSASIGICVVDEGVAISAPEALVTADAAMYQAKLAGPGGVRVVHAT
jgi:diguanylate cyclase (GGDEF)-like protein